MSYWVILHVDATLTTYTKHYHQCVCVCVWLGSFVNTSSGEGFVVLYAAPNPFLSE